MRDAVIVDAVRSPIGKRNGGLSTLHAVDLSAQVLNALVARTGVDPVIVDDVHWGNVISIGQQSGNIGRMAVLGAGWPESVPGSRSTGSAGPPSRPSLPRRPRSSPVRRTSSSPEASR